MGAESSRQFPLSHLSKKEGETVLPICPSLISPALSLLFQYFFSRQNQNYSRRHASIFLFTNGRFVPEWKRTIRWWPWHYQSALWRKRSAVACAVGRPLRSDRRFRADFCKFIFYELQMSIFCKETKNDKASSKLTPNFSWGSSATRRCEVDIDRSSPTGWNSMGPSSCPCLRSSTLLTKHCIF